MKDFHSLLNQMFELLGHLVEQWKLPSNTDTIVL